jgi:hypothetical protein
MDIASVIESIPQPVDGRIREVGRFEVLFVRIAIRG